MIVGVEGSTLKDGPKQRATAGMHDAFEDSVSHAAAASLPM